MAGPRRFALGTLAALLAAALWLRYSGATTVLESRPTEIGAGTLSASAPAPAVAWESRDACEAALRAGPSSPAGRVRIATWNIRWVSDNRPHGAPYLLDHVLVGRDVEELPPLAFAEVGGLCELQRCSGAGVSSTPYYRSLSDHCPVVLELSDVDLD